MQEQAINTFEEGLVMDLNPLTTPNNVLTNCLNGTMITFNGNEFILQNDMGNGRVETAYLPAGYVPVGMKEYGGIIYVASYNPLNGKGQIGSFPSPERNIESTEIDDLGKNLKYTEFLDTKGENVDKFSITKELIEGSLLRPGDKFFIAIESAKSEEISRKELVDKLYNLLTGLGKIENEETKGYIDSNKNNPLTLAICIRTSDRAILDITPKLKRTIQEKTDGGEVYYYLEICSNRTNDMDGGISDARWDEALMNIYNSKITGNLCLVASLPTIDSSSVSNIGKVKTDSENKPIGSRLKFKSVYTYSEENCPEFFGGSELKLTYTPLDDTISDDPINLSISLDDSDKYVIDNIITLERDTQITDKKVFTAKINTLELQEKINEYIRSHPDAPAFSIKAEEAKNNRIIETLPFMSSMLVSGTLNYEMLPFMQFPCENAKPYLGYMSVYKKTGSIDISKLGSGDFEITGWKFYNDFKNGYAKIYINLLAYPSEDLQFLSVKFSIYKNNNLSNNPHIHTLYNDGMFNGGFEFNIPYGEKFEKKDIAVCNIIVNTQKYDVNSSKFVPGVHDFGSNRNKFYVLTTTMFNETYVNGWATDDEIAEMEERKLKYPDMTWTKIERKFFDTYVQEELKYSMSATMITNTTDPKSIKNPEKKLLDSPDAEYESSYEYDVNYVYDVNSVKIINPDEYAVELKSYTLESISDSELSTGDGYKIKDLSLKNKKSINFKIHNIIPIFGRADVSNPTTLFNTPTRYFANKVFGFDNELNPGYVLSLELGAWANKDIQAYLRESKIDGIKVNEAASTRVTLVDMDKGGNTGIGLNIGSTKSNDHKHNEVKGYILRDWINNNFIYRSPFCKIIPLWNFYSANHGKDGYREEGPSSLLTAPFNSIKYRGDVWEHYLNNKYYKESVTLLYRQRNGDLAFVDSIYDGRDIMQLGKIDERVVFNCREALGYFYNVCIITKSNKKGYRITGSYAENISYKYTISVAIRLATILESKFNTLSCNIMNTLDTKNGNLILTDSVQQKNISGVLSSLEAYSYAGIETDPENLVLQDNTIYYMDSNGVIKDVSNVSPDFRFLVDQLIVTGGEIDIRADLGMAINDYNLEYYAMDEQDTATMYFAEHSGNGTHRRIFFSPTVCGEKSRTAPLILSEKHANVLLGKN